MNSDISVRGHLQKAIGEAMKDRAVLAYLEQTKSIDAVINREKTFEELEREVREFLTLAGKDYLIYRSPAHLTMLEERQKIAVRAEAVSVMYASEAAHDQDVMAFRGTTLAGKLLLKKHVKDWIEKKAKKEGQASTWLEIPLPSNHKIGFDKRAMAFTVKPKVAGPVMSWKPKYLAYAVPESSYEQSIPVRYGGLLDRLRVLSERLAQKYAWQNGEATNFILTGVVPYVPAVRSSFNPNTARFTIDADVSVTPRDLADFFRRTKKGVLKSRRTKALGEKHMQLAIFTLDLTEEGAWRVALHKWNKKNRKWRYKDLSIFKRDSLQARRRLSKPQPDPKLLVEVLHASEEKKSQSR